MFVLDVLVKWLITPKLLYVEYMHRIGYSQTLSLATR